MDLECHLQTELLKKKTIFKINWHSTKLLNQCKMAFNICKLFFKPYSVKKMKQKSLSPPKSIIFPFDS
jgi:hypothetical protein